MIGNCTGNVRGKADTAPFKSRTPTFICSIEASLAEEQTSSGMEPSSVFHLRIPQSNDFLICFAKTQWR